MPMPFTTLRRKRPLPGTNLLQWSTNLQNGVWVLSAGCTLTPGQADPFGGTGAFLLTEANATQQQRFYQPSVQGMVTDDFVYSIFAKKQGARQLALLDLNDVANEYAWFDLVTGRRGVTTDASRTGVQLDASWASGWERLWFNSKYVSSSRSFSFGLATTDGTAAGLGNGTGTMLFYGPQFEPGKLPSPYTPTGATIVNSPACLRFAGPTAGYAIASVPWGNATDITFEAWVRLDAWPVGGTGFNTIFASSTSPFSVAGARTLYFQLHSGTTDQVELVAYAQGSAIRLAILTGAQKYVGQRIHVVASFSNTNGVKLYVNGGLVQGPTAACTDTLGNDVLLVGRADGANLGYWKGLIGGVKVWKRELTAAEVLARYLDDRLDTAMRVNLLVDAPCNDGTGTTAADVSGNGNHLTLNLGGVTWCSPGLIAPRSAVL